jgi:subtilisin family serine protease
MKQATLASQLVDTVLNVKNKWIKYAGLAMVVAFSFFISSCKKNIEEINAGSPGTAGAASLRSTTGGNIAVNVVLNTSFSPAILGELKTIGNVVKTFPEINGLSMIISRDELAQIRGLQYVITATPDAERQGSPVDNLMLSDFSNGMSSWDLDAVNVTDHGLGRTVLQDGTGVYVGVLDTGLPDNWRQLFPEERIATQYAKSFGGGGGEVGNVSEQPNKWEHDQNSHGGHVTSTVLGYQLRENPVNGVAPKATVIPVKILGQSGWGWSSVISEGILYIASLKAGVLRNSPVVINMSLGGPLMDALEKAAIDYAISQGVIIVAAAGNSGNNGMGYPGAYAPVISVAAAGWHQEFSAANWAFSLNVPDPTNVSDFYIAGFSSRQLAGQDLDIAAPGVFVVGPYQINSGHNSYYYLSGTSMACPHVAGIVALMAQKKPTLTAAEAETILQATAIPMSEGQVAAGSGFATANAALAPLP